MIWRPDEHTSVGCVFGYEPNSDQRLRYDPDFPQFLPAWTAEELVRETSEAIRGFTAILQRAYEGLRSEH